MMIRTRRRPSVSKGPPVSASQNKEQIFLDAEGKRKEADRRRQDSIGAMKDADSP
jgi:hypothetical protein